MIFVANALPMNGGSTFLIRMAAEMSRRGERPAVLVLRREGDAEIETSLRQNADVFFLDHFLADRAKIFRRHFGIFGLLRHEEIRKLVVLYGPHVHVMGIFGLIFAARWARICPELRVTAGVYHQNEFLFRQASFFARIGQQAFTLLPPGNIVFFNDSSRANYARFFETSFSGSMVLPIGIVLGQALPLRTEGSSPRLISVGNLVDFKTYNGQMIDVMKSLVVRFPGISYEIWGDGPQRAWLQNKITALGLSRAVTLRGKLPYRRFSDTVLATDVFIGSGTAVIEAAALGRAALIGVESNDQPTTYGYLNDVPGLSYNELGLDLPLRSFEDCIAEVLSSRVMLKSRAKACAAKAAQFSIGATVDGFARLGQQATLVPLLGEAIASRGRRLRLTGSLLSLVLRFYVTGANPFGDRRNQSY